MNARFIGGGCLAAVLLSLIARAQDPPLPPIEVKLVEPGQVPHVRLRYDIKPGSSKIMVLGIKTSTETEVAGQKTPASGLPTIEQSMRMKVSEVSDQKISYDFKLVAYKLLEDEVLLPPVRTAISEVLAKSIGIDGNAKVDVRGRTLTTNINVPQGAPPAVVQMVEGMRGNMSNFGSPLPEEPIGMGGKWEVKTHLQAGGIRIQQTSTYTIKELSKDGFAADVAMRQTAEKQLLRAPGLPPGGKIEVQEFKGEGTGTLKVSLNSLVPTSKINTSSTMKADITAQDEVTKMQTSVSVSVSIRPEESSDSADEAN